MFYRMHNVTPPPSKRAFNAVQSLVLTFAALCVVLMAGSAYAATCQAPPACKGAGKALQWDDTAVGGPQFVCRDTRYDSSIAASIGLDPAVWPDYIACTIPTSASLPVTSTFIYLLGASETGGLRYFDVTGFGSYYAGAPYLVFKETGQRYIGSPLNVTAGNCLATDTIQQLVAKGLGHYF